MKAPTTGRGTTETTESRHQKEENVRQATATYT